MDDIYATFDFGYDPEIAEDCPKVAEPVSREALPSRATVNPAWLPPVGRQTTPSSFVWAVIYGLATFKAAKASGCPPSEAFLQASPFYAYVRILEQRREAPDTCRGGRMSWCFDFLRASDGTPNLEQAPAPIPGPGETHCGAGWAIYGECILVSDYAFKVNGGRQFDLRGAAGLDMVRWMIAHDRPLAYGTSLYTDFASYGAPQPGGHPPPIPYVGNGIIQRTSAGRRAGHCMLIIGYDDELGAVLVQNSFGPEWGTEWNGRKGYVWLSYATFQTLAQGSALVIDEM